MKAIVGDYLIETDERQFMVKKKGIIESGKHKGEEKTETLGWFPSIEYALNYLNNKVVLDNDDLKTISRKQNEIGKQIKEFSKLLREV